jgi:hypothetical protein
LPILPFDGLHRFPAKENAVEKDIDLCNASVKKKTHGWWKKQQQFLKEFFLDDDENDFD